VFASAI
jgi:hypothetical protein